MIKLVIISTFISCISISFTGTNAYSHGLGGIDASRTTSEITSISPPSTDFDFQVAEHGERVIITRTSNKEILVLGLDSEPYILLNTSGVFENEKSATRLINDEDTLTYTAERRRQEFANTSNDPKAEPKWIKVSGGNSHRWHDHKAHHMGSVPAGVTDLGHEQIYIQVGNQLHEVNFHRTAAKPINLIVPIVGLVLIAAISSLLLFKFKTLALKIFPATNIAILSVVVITIQLLHVYGYLGFITQDFSKTIGEIIYSLFLIILFIYVGAKSIRLRKLPTKAFWNRFAPLLTVAGISGLIGGVAVEYSSFIEPFPASTFSSTAIRIMISITAAISLTFLMIGFSNVKPDHTSELSKDLQDSNA